MSTHEILPVIIGTAGHVDHGKTSLVKLLTGCETDRLREEQERGLSIDLGFAPCRFGSNRLAGLVDMPGHEDFIRNMVAGAASIDILLLVVAADDGVMPQTREHLRIVSLLRTPVILVALTKIDMVEPEFLDLVTEDIQSLLAEEGYPDAPIYPVSNTTFHGIQTLRDALETTVAEIKRTPDTRAFRMFIERRFHVKGRGTVVTGIPLSGTATLGEELTHNGTTYRVRGVQNYKVQAKTAIAGACTALNLADLPHESVHRGDVLHAPGVYTPTRGCIVQVHNTHPTLTLKRITPMRFHAGTFSCGASVKLIRKQSLAPGSSAFASIHLEEPCILAAGDRFLLRHLNPLTTLGGGMILSREAYRLHPNADGTMERLEAAALAATTDDVLMSELLAQSSAIVCDDDARRATQSLYADADKLLQAAAEGGTLERLDSAWLVTERSQEVIHRMCRELTRYHERQPYAWGMQPELVCRRFDLAPGAFKSLANILTRDPALVVRHGCLALHDFKPALSQKQLDARESLRATVRDAGYQAPARGNLKKDLGVNESDLKLLIRLLVQEGELVVIGSNLMNRSAYDRCKAQLVDLLREQPALDLPRWREATGLGRNLAVSLLEHFDKEGITRRVDEGRVLVDNTDT